MYFRKHFPTQTFSNQLEFSVKQLQRHPLPLATTPPMTTLFAAKSVSVCYHNTTNVHVDRLHSKTWKNSLLSLAAS